VSGYADLAANTFALADWVWARDCHGDEYDDYAALLARTATDLVVARRHGLAERAPFAEEDIEALVHGLILSGLAMTLAGSSRPCSGLEHLVSHAFDAMRLGSGSHGEQVAVGLVLADRLLDTPDGGRALELLEAIGAPLRPQEIGISLDDALVALDRAVTIRPGRHSRLISAMHADREFVLDLAQDAWAM
jgi:glycerol-1-phosphate dehydrogenase [NAD(P)+]